MVSKPWGDSAPYDFMIEHNGRVLRVQVKSTMRIVRGCYRCHVPYNRGQGSPQRLMDFVAAYVIPEDLWYILPARVATCLQGHISLSHTAPPQVRTLSGSLAPPARTLAVPIRPGIRRDLQARLPNERQPGGLQRRTGVGTA